MSALDALTTRLSPLSRRVRAARGLAWGARAAPVALGVGAVAVWGLFYALTHGGPPGGP